jgi:hypothetical protein
MVHVVKAIAIAELEIENGYRPDFHDDYFQRFDQTSLVPEDLDMFPCYLALHKGQSWDTAEKGRIIETLSFGLPIKILAQIDDIIPFSSLDAGAFSRGPAAAQFANLVVGLGSSFVLQSSASNLYQMRKKLAAGLSAPGPALFSVFSGLGTIKDNNKSQKGRGTYLSAAAAMESRAFPAFAFDPNTGSGLASRFSLLNNPNGRSDWTSYGMDCEDDDMQRTAVAMSFTFVDFVAGDDRYRHHFAKVSKADWVREMVPVGDYLKLSTQDASQAIPYVLMINERDEASRYVVDDLIIRAAARIRDNWRALQELGGVNNSHVIVRLEEERAQWEVEKEGELASLRTELETTASTVEAAPVVAAPEAVAAVASEASVVEEAPEPAPAEALPPSDDPWIETVRCTTCNECTDLNDLIFAYNDDMQAFVKDAAAGPFKDIVEAAENCQVAIIHPGKPKDLSEPGLDDLVKRAALFL